MSGLYNLGTIDQLQQNQLQCIERDERQFVLVHQHGEFFLLDNRCPHKGEALCDGDLSDYSIECPWHRARFDIRDGRGLSPLAGDGIKAWPLSIEDGQLIADLSVA